MFAAESSWYKFLKDIFEMEMVELEDSRKLFFHFDMEAIFVQSLDFSSPKPRKIGASKFPKDAVFVSSESSVHVNQHSVLMASFSTVRYFRKSSKSVPTSGVIIPPFNEWKEIEKIKYEKVSSKDGNIHHHKKVGQRKLNYASSKCGAKILASNPEAKYKISILNEKPDEYMLNQCRVKTWFIIELCDTVEATQIELANYELYSSSPREFSVFWSEVYPTHVWHLLGTFEAKDQRTMQTFHLNAKNLGKFIKVIVYSHHGKEHYCPISVIRVLGYSMVEKFEDMEEIDESSTASVSDDNQPGSQIDRNLTTEKEQIFSENIKQESNGTFVGYSSELSIKLCALYFLHCTYVHRRDTECPNEPICRFLMEVLQKFSTNCDSIFCSRVTTASLNTTNEPFAEKKKEAKHSTNNLFPWNSKPKLENAKKGTMSTYDDILKEYNEKYFGQGVSGSILKEIEGSGKSLKSVKFNANVSENFVAEKNFSKQENETIHKGINAIAINGGKEKCICERSKMKEETTKVNKGAGASYIKEFEQDLFDIEKEVDSAGLIQKESVLFKLTARIKASETDLNLINKYLQQLSQSYRQQMEDMQVMFNQTVMAIDAASEKATLTDKKQEESIDVLQQKLTSLTRKVDYLMSGQRDLLKRVVEMHAFFLILEFIIISTIFTIFLNIFQRKNASIMSRMSNSNC